MSKQKNTLLVILGPTASGKTGVAIELASHFNCEIISADSRQFYKEIPIGTAAPDDKQLSEVKHYFIGNLSIFDEYNVSQFEHDVLNLLNVKFKENPLMIMTGGSGLYIDAVCNGIDDLPDPDEKLREELKLKLQQQGIESLQQQLKDLDPAYYNQVDLQNPKRLLRAIEVCLQTGKPYSELRKSKPAERGFNIIKIGLNLPREKLYNQINLRTEIMINSGWIDEARNVFKYNHLNSLNTVGYKELFKYLSNEWTLELAIEKIKTNTRHYAKRQITWFKRDHEIQWFTPHDTKEIIRFIRTKM